MNAEERGLLTKYHQIVQQQRQAQQNSINQSNQATMNETESILSSPSIISMQSPIVNPVTMAAGGLNMNRNANLSTGSVPLNSLQGTMLDPRSISKTSVTSTMNPQLLAGQNQAQLQLQSMITRTSLNNKQLQQLKQVLQSRK